MKQIYYTQCPIGYGLGASNGFQVKRLSPGFPLTGDFRHFSLRAFVAGTRTLAPPTLRYRQAEGEGEGEGGGSVAELAWLTPRSHEYETERGRWGRPGGHFAHGLQLDAAELRSIASWPAGLHDRPFWIRTDPEPTHGRPPPPLELSAVDLSPEPTFTAVAALAGRDDQDADLLARLLTAAALAARAGRTLFLVDDAARLPARIALLTFVFPEPWRAALTFSTYHDRPEELPGFRLSGTIPAARPNRAALLAQGFVADLTSNPATIEPAVTPPEWARTLAGWFVRQGGDDAADWEATRRRALTVRVDAEERWSEETLDRLIGLPRMLRLPPPRPIEPADWTALAQWTTWAGRSVLADEWASARPPAWWLDALAGAAPAVAWQAVLEQLQLPPAWKGPGRAAGWGRVVARCVASASDPDRLGNTSAALNAAPAAARPAFAGELVRALEPALAASILNGLASEPGWDRRLLLPLEAHAAAVGAIAAGVTRTLQDSLNEALAMPDAFVAVLDALRAAAGDRPEARALLAGELASVAGTAESVGVIELHRWALAHEDLESGAAWLGPYWRRLFADRLDCEAWRAVVRDLPSELRLPLTRVVLHVAAGPGVVEEAFRWAIEELVLTVPEAERPHDRGWPVLYVDRLPSGLDLLKRLFARKYRHLGIRRWLEKARERGEMPVAQAARIADCERYARVLMGGDARALMAITLPEVPAEDRGRLLGQILNRLADGSEESLNLALDSCRAAWPRAFEPRTPGLAGLAEALAVPLRAELAYPPLWLERLMRVLQRLGLPVPADGRLEPDGLAAELVAATTLLAGGDGDDTWRLRQFLFQHASAWPTLAADIRHELCGLAAEPSVKRLQAWDAELDKGKRTARFFEVWLNACNPPQLVAAVAARAADLRHLDLPWWDFARHADARNDLREAFVRLAPLAPLAGSGTLAQVRRWLFPPREPVRDHDRDHEVGSLAPLDPEGPRLVEGDAVDPRDERQAGPISARGMIRWQCLEAITLYAHPDETVDTRWQRLKEWTRALPLALLETLDRRRFLAWVIVGFPRLESDRVARLAHWLFRSGFTDSDGEELSRWYDDLAEIAQVDGSLRLERAPLVSELRTELRRVIQDAAPRGRKTGMSGSPPAR